MNNINPFYSPSREILENSENCYKVFELPTNILKSKSLTIIITEI